MTKEQTSKAAVIQEQLAAGGLTVRVSFTKRGYIRLNVPAETMKNYTCLATVASRAAEILKCNINAFYMAYGE